MNTWTRAAKDSDRERFVWVESGAIKGLAYVNDVWDLFTKNNDGEFTASLLGDELGGIGKLTRLYKDYGWLEALRVHPDFQSKGLGKAIYARYMEQMTEMNLSAVGMYTGYTNVVSRGLAELHGLSLQERFSEFIKSDLTKSDDVLDLELVNEDDGEAFLEKYYDEMDKFVVVNRTFYPVKAGLGEMFAKNKWLYADDEGNVLVAGYRFQPEKALHIPFVHGDTGKLLKSAGNIAIGIGSKALSANRVYNNEEQTEMLLKNDFVKAEHDLITLWKGL